MCIKSHLENFFLQDQYYLDMLKKITLQLVDTSQHAIFLFGSRAGKHHSSSADFDVGILGKNPLPLSLLDKLNEAVEESSIPFDVDFVDFFYAEPEFRKIVMGKIKIWNHPKSIKLN